MNAQAEPAPDLECRALTKRFDHFVAVENIDLAIPGGSFFSILGPSGCGKTTLLRMIAGFLEPTSGDILIKGRSVLKVPPNKRAVNMVFQHLALFPMMSVAENIGYGLRRRRLPREDIARKVDEALARVGLPGLGNKKISQISGGQKQRVAIARCLVLDPDVLLLDEPLGALDLKLRDHMKVELKKLQNDFQTTFIYITHDQSEALVMSDTIAVMNAGRFEQVGPAQELYYRPKTAFVAAFVGDSNRWKGRVESAASGRLTVEMAPGVRIVGTASGSHAEGDTVDIFVRPESITLSRDAAALKSMANRMDGEVVSLLFNGAASRVLVRGGSTGDEIDVALPQTGEFNDLRPGQPISLGWSDAQTTCFGAGPSE
ncbi:MAG: ABC transporter ATP-binding protein [Hyphomicrobiales bacterium]|nr:ABC transporter ATP-binding protein [Hyphomicrobiales bacterium]